MILDASGRTLKPSEIGHISIRKSCGDCHEVEKNAKSLHFNAGESDPETAYCLSCHLPRTGAFRPDGTISRLVVVPADEHCEGCHYDVAESMSAGVHGGADKKPGDHPTCVNCHGGNPHAIQPTAKITRRDRAAICSGCHSDQSKTARYRVDTEAVESYERSFHGKALLVFGKQNSAVCTDCHGYHGVFRSDDPKSPVGKGKISDTCGKCHQGADMNFAMSGANHLSLKIEKTPILKIEEMFFKLLTVGTMAFLILMIALDLRKKVFCSGCRPRAGRAVSLLISMCFVCLVAGLGIALADVNGAEFAWVASAGFGVAAFVANAVRRKPSKRREKLYKRFDVVQRVQHLLLAVSFVVLVLTGMPLRYSDIGWSHYLQVLFGGFDGARVAHRVAALAIILAWVWHTLSLLSRWRKAGFTFSSWTMWPRVKDFADFRDSLAYSLDLRKQPPACERFQWREKFDYFAVYWGIPIMVVSGLALWFPVLIGNHLSDLAWGIAHIAHSDEALLALLAILVWHFYNVHFNPDKFPMNPSFITGTLTESEMAHEHPLEKERIDRRQAEIDEIPKRPVRGK